MKERPILYSTPMAQAKRKGIKTQTRRTNGLEEINLNPSEWSLDQMEVVSKPYSDFKSAGLFVDGDERVWAQCPYGKPGDILWGRETHMLEIADGYTGVVCKAFCPDYPMGSSHWKPSIFMKKKHAQIWERITNIRVERLNDISEEDAIAEGIQPLLASRMQLAMDGQLYKHYTEHTIGIFGTGLRPIESYATLWESINGPGSWDLNPWVWVLTTEILSTTGRPADL